MKVALWIVGAFALGSTVVAIILLVQKYGKKNVTVGGAKTQVPKAEINFSATLPNEQPATARTRYNCIDGYLYVPGGNGSPIGTCPKTN